MAKKTETYSNSIKEIEEILFSIENDSLDVDLLADKVKRASELIKVCKAKLQKTDVEVQKILDDID